MISESSLNFTLTLPVKSPSLVVLLFSSVASVNVAPAKSLLTSDSFVESLAFTPSFQSSVSPTHFFITTGSRPPSSLTLSAIVSPIVKVPGSDVSGVLSSSATPPLSVTVAVTSVPPFTLSLGRVTIPFSTVAPKSLPSVMDQVPLSAFVATIF